MPLYLSAPQLVDLIDACLHAEGVPGVHGTRVSWDGLSRAIPADPARTRMQMSKSNRQCTWGLSKTRHHLWIFVVGS